MRKLFALFALLSTSVFAQMYSPKYDKYSVAVSAGAALYRQPFNPNVNANIAFGYKFAANYDKPVDTVYAAFGYSPGVTKYHVGVQRTMSNDRDRVGLIAVADGGVTRMQSKGTSLVKPSLSTGLGLTMDFTGSPYPAFMNKVSVFVLPKFNYVVSKPVYFSLMMGVSRTF